MATEDLISFKDMCARFDVTPRTLRYYEYIELLSPHREGRSRFYGPKEVARLKLILNGRRFGFSLEEIRQWLSIYEEKGSFEQKQAWLAHANRQIGVINGQIKDLQQVLSELIVLRDNAERELKVDQ